MTKSLSILNKLTVGQLLTLVYPEDDFPFYYIVEKWKYSVVRRRQGGLTNGN